MSGTNNLIAAKREKPLVDASEERAVPQVLGQIRDLSGIDRFRLIALLAVSVSWVGWQVWIAATVPPSPVHARSIHLGFGFVVAFLLAGRIVSSRTKRLAVVIDAALILLAVGCLAHLYINFEYPDFRRLANPEQLDLVLAVTILVLVLVALWRVTGLPLAVTVGLALAYAFYGQFVPGPAGHGGFSPERVLSILYLQLEGLLGSTTGTSATMIFPVLMFGSMLLALGGGRFFTHLAIASLGRTKGAGGKIATVASALFSTVTGTGGSGVAATGSLTIPLMKRTGFSATRAAGIESSASIGGQILPPVMGAAAFAMAELLQISYAEIVFYALIPGILYFVTIFITIHLEASRTSAEPIPESEIPKLLPTLRSGGHFIVPLVGFVLLIAAFEMSVGRSALMATGALIVLEFGRRLLTRSDLSVTDLLDGCVQTARTAVIVAIAVGGIQILIAVVGLTGLGVKLSSLLIGLSGGNLIFLLILTMVASILLGTGLPTLPTYLVLAVLVAPALIESGVHPIAAHLFIFYFGVFGDLTPPTALAPTIAAGIAKAPLLRSMLSAVRYGALGFVLPFIFVGSPGLLLLEGPGQALIDVAVALLAVVLGGVAIAGFGLTQASVTERLLAALAAISLVLPMLELRVAGLLVAVVLVTWQVRKARIARNEKSINEKKDL
ncbi:TRAP transporter permease [Nesterenkonia ebinurensis]|uniref:TRAP transporter permease n=1 Tax=Nesterenkonia ebinurensis TaxID=2608252 RepID=UPI00123DFD35|nr:TRAP transporter fused permease subunit [Nesterenkonia ebinurensis]